MNADISEWDHLAKSSGRKCVMDLHISDETLDDVTHEQVRYLMPLLWSMLTGKEKLALDYGCGAGRFTPQIAETLQASTLDPVHVVGFDPSGALLAHAPMENGVRYIRSMPETFFTECREHDLQYDLIWIFNVLGGVADEGLQPLADHLVSLLSPNGLLFLGEHTNVKHGTWWRFRPMQAYADLFPKIKLRRAGECMQLENPVTILAGRKS